MWDLSWFVQMVGVCVYEQQVKSLFYSCSNDSNLIFKTKTGSVLKRGKSQINIHSLWDTQNPHWSLQIDSCNLDVRLASHLAWTFPWPGPRLFRVASIKNFNFSFRRKICIKDYYLLQLFVFITLHFTIMKMDDILHT